MLSGLFFYYSPISPWSFRSNSAYLSAKRAQEIITNSGSSFPIPPTHPHLTVQHTNKHQPPESILHVSKTVNTLCPVISISYTVLTADLAKTQTADDDRWVFVCVFSHISEQEAGNLAAAGSRGRQIKSQKVRKLK